MPSPVATTVTPSAGATSTFNTWAQAVSSALTEAGVAIVPGVTGAVTFPVGTVPAANTAPHFEIRKLAAPQSGAPEVYIRLEYGRGGASGPLLRVQVGTGVNTGTGALTGPGSEVAAANVLPTANSADATSRTMWCTYDGDGFALVHAIESTNFRAVLVVERQRRPDGVAAPNSGWPNIGFSRLINNNNHLHVDPVAVAPGASTPGISFATTRIPAIVARTLIAGASMRNAALDSTVFPLFLPNRQGLYNSKMMVAIPSIDGPLNTTISVTHLGGVSRTYRCAGNGFTSYDHMVNAGVSFAIWWSD